MKIKNTKNWVIILAVIATLIFFNLKNYYDYYGKNYNSERENFGVLKIPETWRTKYRGTTTKLWGPENFKEITKGRIGKEVILKNGKIYLERDRIINKSNGKYIGLEVSYEFDTEPNFSYKYFEVKGNTQLNSRKLSKEEFDKIIKDWEIKMN